jgi:hypothetical protein
MKKFPDPKIRNSIVKVSNKAKKRYILSIQPYVPVPLPIRLLSSASGNVCSILLDLPYLSGNHRPPVIPFFAICHSVRRRKYLIKKCKISYAFSRHVRDTTYGKGTGILTKRRRRTGFFPFKPETGERILYAGPIRIIYTGFEIPPFCL